MRKGKSRFIRDFVLMILLIAILGALSYGTYFYKILNQLSKSKAGSENIMPVAVKGNEPVNILIMGVDIGTPGAKDKNDPKRTDTILLMNYNPKNDEINLISIPRDTLIRIDGKNSKINAAHAVGGVSYLIDSVQKLLDLRINYYGKIDYAGFRELVDAIGGVDMKINNKMDYDDPVQNLHIHFKKGETVHLDGEKAEEFFRWRENNDGTGLAEGDLGRIENQHAFIEKVVEKIKSQSIISNFTEVLSVIPKYAETNMGPEEIIKYGYLFTKANKEKLITTRIKGDAQYIKGVSYFIYDENQNKELLAKLHNEDITTSINLPIGKSKYRFEIINGTYRSGLAGELSQELQRLGYNKAVLVNSPKSSKSKITFFNVDEKIISIVKREIGIENIEIKSTTNDKFDIIVLLGDDYS